VSLLDKAGGWIREVLAFLPASVVTYVWLPLLVIVVFIAAMLFMRRLLPLLGRLGAALLRSLAALVGALLLTPDLIVATVWRLVRGRPPAVVYHYGVAVASSMIGLARTSGAVSSGLARVARVHGFFVLLACAAVLWTWNHGHCPTSATPTTPTSTATPPTTCVRPFANWLDNFGDDQPAPPDPKKSTVPSPAPSPVSKKK
jgi:hypothetical protein